MRMENRARLYTLLLGEHYSRKSYFGPWKVGDDSSWSLDGSGGMGDGVDNESALSLVTNVSMTVRRLSISFITSVSC